MEVLLLTVLAGLFVAGCSSMSYGPAVDANAGVETVDLTGASWRLWLDPEASWREDKIYLPDEVELGKLPTNAPTGGWSALSGTAGIPVTLPGTVEEHYWSRGLSAGATPSELVSHNGSYTGVSLVVLQLHGPAPGAGERCEIHFRGTRLRAEVYVNRKLVGYNIITELPFTVDATGAIRPGVKNQLAVRITNPGGQLAWDDTGTMCGGATCFRCRTGLAGWTGAWN